MSAKTKSIFFTLIVIIFTIGVVWLLSKNDDKSPVNHPKNELRDSIINILEGGIALIQFTDNIVSLEGDTIKDLFGNNVIPNEFYAWINGNLIKKGPQRGELQLALLTANAIYIDIGIKLPNGGIPRTITVMVSDIKINPDAIEF